MVKFKWEYMRKHVDTDRMKYLSNLLGKHLKTEDKVFDLLCGYSPLCDYLIGNGYNIRGVDGCLEAVEWLREYYPDGEWIHQVYGFNLETSIGDSTVLLILGVAEPQHRHGFQKYLNQLIKDSNIRLILTDTLVPGKEDNYEQAPWYRGYLRNIEVFKQLGYVELDQGEYIVREPRFHLRTYALYGVPEE